MAFEFKLEDPGEGIHEAEILEVLVSKGDTVSEGDNVVVAETDKAAVEIPSPVSGAVQEIKVGEGDIVEVGDVLMVFDDSDNGETTDKESGSEKDEDDDREGAADSDAAEKQSDEAEEAEASDESEEEKPEEKEPEEDDSEEEGQLGGKKSEAAESETKQSARRKPEDKTEPDEDQEGKAEADREDRGGGPVPAAPAVRRLARELGVDLKNLDGSGRDGRVLEEDVRAAAGATESQDEDKKQDKKNSKGDGGAESDSRLPDFSRWGPTERIPLRSIRRAIAKRMARSWREIPHVTHQDEIDITELETLRRAHADEVEQRGGQLTLTPFFVKALVAALKEHPRFNASLDPDREEIVTKGFYNIGVALDSDRGLLVPVIHDADAKSVVDVAVELGELAEAVRGGKATRDQLRGGTFSLTNVGALGGTQFSPIINHPEAAIFGTARAQLRPVVIGDLDDNKIEVRLILPVCVTFDHRINDGADAARFMDTVKAVLSDPEAMMLMS